MNRSRRCFTLSGARNAKNAYTHSRALPLPIVTGRLAIRTRRALTLLLIGSTVFLLPVIAAAGTLTGTVKNSTTGKPGAGDQVVLFSLGQGMEEAGRTTADAQGNFSFKLNSEGTYLIRTIHDGVTYHSMMPTGKTSTAVEVYDVSKTVDGIEIFTDIMYLTPARGQLLVTREFGVRNNSNPPRTQLNPRNLEFYLPDGARLVSASAMAENGNPLRSAPSPESEKNRYSFFFPLRPGLTRFEITYLFPYKGGISIDPKSLYPLRHFVVVYPKTMQFTVVPGSNFQSIHFPDQPDSNVEMASDIPKGDSLAFRISGVGRAETGEPLGTQGNDEGTHNSDDRVRSAQPNRRPGGGLGLPIDAPDPLHEYRWWILGGLTFVFLIGGIYVGRRRPNASRQRTTGYRRGHGFVERPSGRHTR